MAMNRGRCVQGRAWAIYLELLLLWVGSYSEVRAQMTSAHSREKTYCNLVNLPYRFQLQPPSRREAADPTLRCRFQCALTSSAASVCSQHGLPRMERS
jgi:hypothetical protein